MFGMDREAIEFANSYLSHYGYQKPIDVASAEGADVPTLATAVAAFQGVAGLEPNGVLTPQTVQLMRWPRCGVPDGMLMTEEARWRKNRLTYFVDSYVSGISRDDQEDLIRLAWADWTSLCDLEVTRTDRQQRADIVISTGRGQAHGFDGPGGTLAWAQLPPGNDSQLLTRFDMDERWLKEKGQPGILFRAVACHEFGHLLGLDHSRHQGALMAPFYRESVVGPRAVDDVSRIVSLYGAATTPPPPPPPPPPTGKKFRLVLWGEGEVSAVTHFRVSPE